MRLSAGRRLAQDDACHRPAGQRSRAHLCPLELLQEKNITFEALLLVRAAGK